MRAPLSSKRWAVVIAGADRAEPRAEVTALRRKGLPTLILGLIALVPAPATAAQFGAVISIFNDDRFRGVSVSDGRPVATFDLSYDAPSGLYASLSGSVVATRDEGLRALSGVLNGGYAKRLRHGLTIDFGASHLRYSHYSGLSSGRDITEVYAGLVGKIFGARISVSPNYFGVARWTAHGEIDAHVDLSRNTAMEGEVGLLAPFGKSAYEANLNNQFDARLGLAQRAGPVMFHAALSGRSGGDEIYGGRGHNRVALVLGVSTAL